MLARASSDAGTRLRRSKSISTVHRPPPPILELFDPDAAQQQAIAAATAAFFRAQAQDAAFKETKRSSEVSRSRSNASRKSLTMQGQGSHFPPRGSSFRSLHPQSMQPCTDTQQPPQAAATNAEKFPPFHPTPSIDRPLSAPRPLSSQPSNAFNEHSRPSTQPKGGRQSASSITSQQIRKARSMYYASSVQTGSPIARPPTMYLTTQPPVSVSPSLKVPVARPPTRSLVPSPLVGPRIPITVAADESVDKARDKYLQTFQQRSIKHKPSLFVAPFIKRQDRGKDKDKRTSSSFVPISASSERTPDDSTAGVTQNDFMPQPDKRDKRSFSGSLKSKIKRVFRRSSRPSPSLPVQQIEASRDYFGTGPADVRDVSNLYAIPSPEGTMLQRVRARTPSFESSRPVFLQPNSRTSSHGSQRSNRSDRSLHSEVHATNVSASRVTSWGTTSTADTLTQRAIKRMSVIHESKDSIGSEADRAASTSIKRKSLPLAAFREPMPMESLMEETSTPIDPKRVFSALMKEIETAKATESTSSMADHTPGAESDVFESSQTKVLYSSGRQLHSSTSKEFHPSTGNKQRPPSRRAPSAAAQSTQSKTSTIRSLGRAIRSTIRTVTPVEQRSSPCPERPAASVRGAVRIPKGDEELSSAATTPDPDEECVNIDIKRLRQQHQLPKVISPSRVQIEKRVEKAKHRWKTPLDNVEQLHSPLESERTYNVANFACQTVAHEDHLESLEKVEVFRTDIPAPPVSPPPRPIMSPLSPSVYSRDTDSISILPNDSVMSFNGPDELERHHHGGSAVILTSQSVRSYAVGTASPRRSDSARSSHDWKTWLSHEVSSMEFTSQEDLKIDEKYLTPSGKHQKDGTRTSHTEEEDTTVILRPSCDTVILQADQSPPTANDSVHQIEVEVVAAELFEQRRHTIADSPVPEHMDSRTGMLDEVCQVELPLIKHGRPPRPWRPGSIPLMSKQRPPSKPGHASSASQPSAESLRSGFMNDRFPFINTGRSSSNNSTRSSCLSRSPHDSVASSLKSTKAKSSPRIYSDLSAPLDKRTSLRMLTTAFKRDKGKHESKENITPSSVGGSKRSVRPIISPPMSTSPGHSLQPLSSAALNRSSTHMAQYTSNAPHIKPSKHNSSTNSSPPRPRLSATIRPILSEKLTRRPKSAFDLRGTHTTVPHPVLGIRRPALQFKASTSSLASSKEPSPGAETRVIDSILEEGERSGSTTPGQRMADRFLRERQSTGVLVSGKHRGGLKLVREDTPAFL